MGFKGCLPEILSEIDAAGALKYNYMMLEFGEKFPYKDNPFTDRPNAYSPADVEAIKAATKRHHIEIIPLLQIITHDEWLHAHPRYKEEIAEDPKRTGWSTAACHMSELGREVQLMAIREQIEFSILKHNQQVKPVTFHIFVCPSCICSNLLLILIGIAGTTSETVCAIKSRLKPSHAHNFLRLCNYIKTYEQENKCIDNPFHSIYLCLSPALSP
jgi:hypothetical protein